MREHLVHGLLRRVLVGLGLEREGGGGLVARLERLGAAAQVLGEEDLGAPVEVDTVGLGCIEVYETRARSRYGLNGLLRMHGSPPTVFRTHYSSRIKYCTDYLPAARSRDPRPGRARTRRARSLPPCRRRSGRPPPGVGLGLGVRVRVRVRVRVSPACFTRGFGLKLGFRFGLGPRLLHAGIVGALTDEQGRGDSIDVEEG